MDGCICFFRIKNAGDRIGQKLGGEISHGTEDQSGDQKGDKKVLDTLKNQL